MTEFPKKADDSFEELRLRLADFAAARDWDQFHSPKNLAMALIAECGELIEHFQWLSETQSHQLPPQKHHAVAQELADILIYLVRIADKMGVELVATAHEKISQNESRYPAQGVRSDARRAGEYN